MKGDEMIELDVPVNFVSILESNSDVPGSSLSSILYQFRVWILIRRDHLFREDISYRQITVCSNDLYQYFINTSIYYTDIT